MAFGRGMGGRGLRERRTRGRDGPGPPSKPVPRRQRFLRGLIFLDYIGVTLLYLASDEDTSIYSFASSTADILGFALLRSLFFLVAFWPVKDRYGLRSIAYVAAVAALSIALLGGKWAASEGAGQSGVGDIGIIALFYSFCLVTLQVVAFGFHAVWTNRGPPVRPGAGGSRRGVYRRLAADEENGFGSGGSGGEEEKMADGTVKGKGKEVSSEPPPLKPSQLVAIGRPEAFTVACGCFFALASAGANMALPTFIGRIVDVVGRSGSREAGLAELRAAMAALVAIALLGGLASFARSYLLSLSSERVVARLRKRLMEAILSQEIAFFDENRTGELVNRLSGDCQVVQSAVTQNVAQLLRSALQVVAGVGLLVHISWRLTLLMLAVTPAVSIGAVVFGRFMKAVGRQVQDALALATVAAEEAISNIRTVRSFSREAWEHGRYARRVDEAYRMAMRTAVGYAAFDGFVSTVAIVSIVLVLFYGGRLALDGQLTPGTLLSFVLYMIFTGTALAGISRIFADVMKAAGAGARIFELIDRKPAVNTAGGERPAECAGEVEFVDVEFSYPARAERRVLSRVSLHLQPGRIVALVGPSGGGKTTVVNLLERFYDCTAGRITVDGRDVRELDPVWLHEHVGLVSQEPVLFAASIEENIRYGVHDESRATDEAVERAARLANAHDFIVGFPEKYKTAVGERGVRLSGGQKQRIAIARALLMDPKILLLDEATSALDAESEHVVQEAIDRLMQGRSVLVVAHRLSTVKHADVVCVVNGGRIVEQGRHEELLARPNGLYRQLVRRQLDAGSGLLDADPPAPGPSEPPLDRAPDGGPGDEPDAALIAL